MARQTIRPEGQDMRLGEDNIHLTVAVVAGVGSEGRHILAVAIFTDKRFTRRLFLVPFQRISQRLVREGVLPHLGQ